MLSNLFFFSCIFFLRISKIGPSAGFPKHHLQRAPEGTPNLAASERLASPGAGLDPRPLGGWPGPGPAWGGGGGRRPPVLAPGSAARAQRPAWPAPRRSRPRRPPPASPRRPPARPGPRRAAAEDGGEPGRERRLARARPRPPRPLPAAGTFAAPAGHRTTSLPRCLCLPSSPFPHTTQTRGNEI